MTSRLRGRAELLPVLLLTAALGLPGLGWPLGLLDEPILFVLPERILHGDLPYRDFSTVYGPTHWLVLSGLLGAGGVSVLNERLVGVLWHLLLVAGVVEVTRRDGRGLAVLSGTITALLLFPLGDGPYAWVGFSALVVWVLALLQADQPTAGRAFTAGVLAGAAAGFRPDAVLLVAGYSLVLLRGRGVWRPAVLGAAVGLLPLLFVVAFAPGEFVHDILGRGLHGAGQSRLPMPWHIRESMLMLTALLVSVAVGQVAALVARERRTTAFAIVAVLVLPQALQLAEPVHFLYASLLVLPFTPQLLQRLLAATGAVRASVAPLGAGLLAAAVMLLGGSVILHPLIATIQGEGPRSETIRWGDRSVPVFPSEARMHRDLLAAIARHSRPGSRIFVWDRDTQRPIITNVFLYYLLPLQHPFNVELSPGLSNTPGSHLARDISRADLLVFLEPGAAHRRANYPFEKTGPADAERVIARDFCKVEQLPAHSLYVRCGHPLRR